MVEDIGSIRLGKLLEFFSSPKDILNAPLEKLRAVSGISQKTACQISAFKKENLAQELNLAKSLNLTILTIEDNDYPENLRQIPGAPIVIYVLGRLEQHDKFSIAIVGSRRASYYGLSCAEKFAQELSQSGLTVVSGMARGIDTAAHKGALKAGGRTIAVLGSGFHNLYPPENKDLAEEIAQAGAVVSEFPLSTPPRKENFPRRNRIISGLSEGVLVVEAARNSGALITADFALEQGREVFALPGKVDARTAFGTNELIKQGAKLVCSVEDIVEEINLGKYISHPRSRQSTENIPRERLAGQEEGIYNILSGEPLLLDDIVEQANLNVTVVLDMLFRLQMKKLIQQLPGKHFVKSN